MSQCSFIAVAHFCPIAPVGTHGIPRKFDRTRLPCPNPPRPPDHVNADSEVFMRCNAQHLRRTKPTLTSTGSDISIAQGTAINPPLSFSPFHFVLAKRRKHLKKLHNHTNGPTQIFLRASAFAFILLHSPSGEGAVVVAGKMIRVTTTTTMPPPPLRVFAVVHSDTTTTTTTTLPNASKRPQRQQQQQQPPPPPPRWTTSLFCECVYVCIYVA